MQKDKIVKFKNGNITIYMYDTFYHNDIDSYYNNEITMCDLYFNQVNGYMYLIDFNTSKVYDFSHVYINILQFLDNELKTHGKIKLYPLSKKEAKSILQDLDNGY